MTETRELPPLKSDKEISGPWLEAMLGRKIGTPVIVESWSVRLPEGREGFLSEIAFVEVEFMKQEVSQKECGGTDEESTWEMGCDEPSNNGKGCGGAGSGGEERSSMELGCEPSSSGACGGNEQNTKKCSKDEGIVGEFERKERSKNEKGTGIVKRQKIKNGEGKRRENCRLVFKFLPHDPALISFLDNGDLAEREVEFYKFMSSSEFQDVGVEVPVPEVYYASYTKDAITLILRDLNQDDYGSVIIRDGSSLDQTKTAFRAIASVHAAGYLYLQRYGKQTGLKTLAREFKTEFYEEFFQQNMKTLVDMYKGTSLSEIFEALIPLSAEIRATSHQNPFIETVVHGDLWAGQLLYSQDQQFASIIDWQFCHLDNPVGDIMSMFFMSTDPRVLENHLTEILEDYWTTFCNILTVGGGNTTETGRVWKVGVKDHEGSRNILLTEKENSTCHDSVGLEELVANVEEMWMFGFMFLTVSLHDFMNGDNLSRDRLDGALTFLEKRAVFRRFLEKFGGRKPE